MDGSSKPDRSSMLGGLIRAYRGIMPAINVDSLILFYFMTKLIEVALCVVSFFLATTYGPAMENQLVLQFGSEKVSRASR